MTLTGRPSPSSRKLNTKHCVHACEQLARRPRQSAEPVSRGMCVTMTTVCGFRSTASGEPCQNLVAPGTVKCAASHPVDSARFVRRDQPGGVALLDAPATFELEDVVSHAESAPTRPQMPSTLILLNDPLAALAQPVVEWRRPDGTLHRNPADGPAVECLDGSQHFYVDGELHRMDGPAVVDVSNQVEKWYRHGELLRPGSRPAVDDTSPVPHRETDPITGVVTWFIANPSDEAPTRLRHNRWAPAVVHPDGTTECYVLGHRHCINGRPAVLGADGSVRHFVFGDEVPADDRTCGCD